jgi:hypothetical protein
MTASEQAKQYGLKSLAEVAKLSNTSFQTLNNYHKNNPKRFDIILLGCVKKLKNEQCQNSEHTKTT